MMLNNLKKASANPIRAFFTVYVRLFAKNKSQQINFLEKRLLWLLGSSMLPFTVESGKRIAYLRYLQDCGLTALPDRYFEPVPRVEDLDEATAKPSLIAKDPGETADMIEIQSLLKNSSIHSDFENWINDIQENKMFRGLDAFAYRYMIKKYKPQQIIEIGSGYSAHVALKTCEENGLNTKVTSVEPFPSEFLVRLSTTNSKLQLIQKRIQDVQLDDNDLFSQLEPNDILFIDSTHVCSMGGDLPVIFCQILPKLKKGVIVHVHDVSWPYDYPRSLVYDSGRFYNELYLMAAVLNHGNYEYLFGSYHLLLKNGCWLKKSADFPYNSGMSLWMHKTV